MMKTPVVSLIIVLMACQFALSQKEIIDEQNLRDKYNNYLSQNEDSVSISFEEFKDAIGMIKDYYRAKSNKPDIESVGGGAFVAYLVETSKDIVELRGFIGSLVQSSSNEFEIMHAVIM